MTKKKLESLPAEARAALNENSGEAASRMIGKHYDSVPTPNDGQRTVVKLSAEQEAQWKKMVDPVLADWANSRANGQKTLDAFKTQVESIRAEAKK